MNGAATAPKEIEATKEVETMVKKARDPEPKGKEKKDSKHDRG